MITRPRRSVTFFFVPLIDVLILLFCIFLLMPFVSEPEEESIQLPTEESVDTTMLPRSEQEAIEEIERLKRRLEQMTNDLNAMKRRQQDLSEQIRFRILQIDGKSGELYYYAPERRIIANQAQAQTLIDETRRESGVQEPFFLILWPRTLEGTFPTDKQLATYKRWFSSVEHYFDNPYAEG